MRLKVGVYGLGRFGAFWAGVLAKHFEVVGYSRSLDRPTPPGIQRVALKELFEADVVFLCCSISALEDVLKEIAPFTKNGQLIADTCSVKVWPAEKMQSLLPAGVKLLATHPMFGPDSAKNGLTGLPVVVYNLRDAQNEIEYWTGKFASWGLTVLNMTPQEHDLQAAYSQGVTHFLGRVLSDMGLKDYPLATQGYKRLLDIVQQTCNDPYQLFLDLQKYNPYTSDMREDLKKSLEKIMMEVSR